MSRRSGVVGIVLAGGASRRFGGDKLAAEIDGRPILHHALAAVVAAVDEAVVVLAPDAPHPTIPPDLSSRLRFARDETPYAGPLAGLAAGLAPVDPAAFPIALVVGGDMPRLVPSVLVALVDALVADRSVDAVVLETARPSPLPLAVRVAPGMSTAAGALAAGARSLRALLDALPSGRLPASEWHALDPHAATLVDVDVPDDLANAIAAGRAPGDGGCSGGAGGP